jgi:hypothetical protein
MTIEGSSEKVNKMKFLMKNSSGSKLFAIKKLKKKHLIIEQNGMY